MDADGKKQAILLRHDKLMRRPGVAPGSATAVRSDDSCRARCVVAFA